MNSRAKLLILNADDFGFTPDVNAGIIETHRNGILTAATLMANGGAFEDAVRLAGDNPRLDIGCHLVLVQGESVRWPGRPLPATLAALVRALAAGHIPVYEELRAQIERILQSGLRPTHLDTHKHTHVLPPVLDAVARLGSEFGIRWVRRPFDFAGARGGAGVPLKKRLTARALSPLAGRFAGVLERHGCRYTDHFAGFQLTGRLEERTLAAVIRALPTGTAEFMCHPGFCGPDLRAEGTRLKDSRVVELEALTAPAVRDALAEAGVTLATYTSLENGPVQSGC